jgi:hypothetical protein
LAFALQRRELLVVFGTEREIKAHFVPTNIGVRFGGKNEIFWQSGAKNRPGDTSKYRGIHIAMGISNAVRAE